MPEHSTSRVLHGVDLNQSPRAISPPATIDDPAVLALVEREVARAHADGLREGQALGRAESQAAAGALAASVEKSLHVAAAAAETLTDHLAGRISGLAVDVATAVVGAFEFADNGVLGRVEQALRVIDDRPLTIHAHADDVAMLEDVCPPEVEVQAVHDLQRGEARVTGRWADADLTWDAVWTSVREVLDVE